MRLELTDYRQVPIIRVHGRVIGGPNHYERFEEIFDRALVGKPARIVIDLTDCRYVQSPGVGMIMAARTAMVNRRGRLDVVLNTERIRRLFDLLQLNRVVDIYESLDHAFETESVPVEI